MLDFSAFPPEFNSARMYSGPGSGPMLAAAAAWSTIAVEMRSAATSYGAVVSELTDESWLGGSSMLMLAAATPYLAWLSTTATQAQQAGAQAYAAAAAYESAFAATVPPAVVAANRAHLAMLMTNNVFGQNAAAIAATEAQYGDMWAQDAAAMNGYAAASRTAAQLTPLTSPQSGTGSAAGTAPPTSAAAGNSTLSGLADWLGIAPNSNTSSTGLAGLMNFLDGSDGSLVGSFLNNATVANFSNAFTTSGLMNPTSVVDSVTAFSYLFGAMAADGGLASDMSDLTAGLVQPGALAPAAAAASAVSAQIGHANLVGALSVPPGWASAGPSLNPLAAAAIRVGPSAYQGLTGTPMVMADMGGVGLPGMPMGGIAGAAEDAMENAPVYGFRPAFVARPPAAG